MNNQPLPPSSDVASQSDTNSPTVQTVMPPPTAQPATSVQTPKSNKGLIAALIGVGVVVLLAIIAAIVYFVFFYISKADYKHAAAQTNAVITAYNKLDSAKTNWSSAASDETSSDSTVASKKADYESANKAYQSAVTALSNERALKNSKVKAAYDSFAAKNKDFMANNDSIVQTMPTLRKIAIDCSNKTIGSMGTHDLSQLVAVYDKAMGPCTDAMKELSLSKNSDAASVGKKAVSHFADMRTHIVAMQQVYIANDRTTFESEYNAALAAASSMGTVTDLSNIKQHQDSLSPETALNHLASVIQSLQ